MSTLPDTRAKSGRGARPSKLFGWTEPVYCYNCGVDCGSVPSASTFAFVLCDKCAENDTIFTGYEKTDLEVHWAKIREAMMNEYGRLLTPMELARVVEADASSLAALIRQGRGQGS